MNKIEELKRERDGLDVKEAIAQYARTGWESISEGDIQRLKWYGLFLRNPTPGYFMIRVRIPGGNADAGQIKALADIAQTYGNGLLDPHHAPTGPIAADPHPRCAGHLCLNGGGPPDIDADRYG
jgi:sulfite reductase beta subunit-like hemoprotein